jgi:hypothetical protein
MKNEITHPLERYKRIADPTIRQQCIDNFDETQYKQITDIDSDDGTLSDAIASMCFWAKTPQGHAYWQEIYDKILAGTLPLLPEPIEEPSELDQLRTENEKLREFIQFFANKYDAIEEDDLRAVVFKDERFKAKYLLNK